MIETNYTKLNKEQKMLLDAAEKVMENSYSPYSGFSVGAAVLTESGEIVGATNVENAVYHVVHAEVAAIAKAVSMGHKKFKSMAVIAKGDNHDTKDVCGPCGECRQILFEFAGGGVEVISSNTRKDRVLIATIKDLLPYPFGPKTLEGK
ncbi:MAG: cytidine deaminase [Candidatus Aenigmarchaeota archaeon]|nr:cytidine deaminase [Candidatus Aenigmarchaeota archaeon]